MKTKLVLSTVFLIAGSLIITSAAPKEDVMAAAKKLAEKGYGWKTSTENAGGGGGRGGAGTQEGKISPEGLATVTIAGGQNTTEAVLKGDKVAVKGEDGWQTVEELTANAPQGGVGRGRGGARMFRNFKAPAARAQELLGQVGELKAADGVVSGDLTEAGAKALLSLGGRGGGNAPEISGAKGSVKFWIKEGVLMKIETHVKGSVSFNGNDREIDRTTTTEIKEVGSTVVTVPEEAKKKLS